MSAEKTDGGTVDLGVLLGSLLGGGAGKGDAAKSDGGGISSDAIGAVLNDPQMMAKLPEVMAMLKPMMSDMASMSGMAGAVGSEQGGAEGATAAVEAASVKPAQDGGVEAEAVIASPSKRVHDRRLALLKALRPYMSPRRQEAIDYILRMDRFGNMFRNQ